MKGNQATFWSLFGAIAFAVIAGVFWYLAPDIPLIWQIGFGLAAAAFVGHLMVSRTLYADLLSKKTTRLGLRTGFNAVLVLAIFVFINMIVSNYDVKKDLTKDKLHSLSDQSRKVVEGLQEEVVMRAFINPTQMQEFEPIFERYTYHSKKLRKEYVDIDKDPLAVERFNIRAPGTLIIESGNRSARVENLNGPDDPKLEEKITNAIIQATKGGKKKLYYVSGHGERLLSDNGREGYSDMKEALENSRYEVHELVLVDKGIVPSDAELVMVAGPKSDFLEPELKALETYVHKGGKLLFMVEPTSSPTLKPFLAKFGADWNPKKVVVETNSLQQLAGGNPLTPIVTNYERGHDITRETKQLSLFPISTPVEKTKEAPKGMTVSGLLSTSNRSIEVDLKGDKVTVNQAKDRKGPLNLAIAASGPAEKDEAKNILVNKAEEKKPDAKPEEAKPEEKNKEFRVVVVGDSDFATNSARRFGVNADLFQNMLSWLAQEEDLISIRPRTRADSEFEITEQRSRVINLASIVIMPILMFLSGLGMWITRKRL